MQSADLDSFFKLSYSWEAGWKKPSLPHSVLLSCRYRLFTWSIVWEVEVYFNFSSM